MTEHTVQHNFKTTPAQANTLPVLMAATGKNKSELIRHALSVIAAMNGVKWTDDMTRRGEWKRERTIDNDLHTRYTKNS